MTLSQVEGHPLSWDDEICSDTSPSDYENPCEQIKRYADKVVQTIVADDLNLAKTAIAEWRPFPVDVLPEPLREFVTTCSKAIGCDQSFIAMPMLTVLAAAIGNTRVIELKQGWEAPSIIWSAVVGESGTSKTPAFKLALQAVRQLERDAMERNKELLKQHEIAKACHKKAMTQWQHKKNTDELPPEEPDPPKLKRLVVSDTTVEALAPILLSNPRGLLMARDELAGWFGSFDRYASTGGGDASHWLSMHNGESITVDRKTGTPRTIYVPDASVSIIGGIQPKTLHRALGTEHRDSGLAARFLLACPPRKAKEWTEAEIAPAVKEKVAKLIERLYGMKAVIDESDNLIAATTKLTSEAKRIFRTYYNNHNREQANLTGDVAAAWSKLEEYAARLALVIHYVRWASDDLTLNDHNTVDAESMTLAIKLTEWFKYETRRVYALLSESDSDGEQRRLLELIGKKGSRITVREAQQGIRELKTSEEAKAALDRLAKDGYGHWEAVKTTSNGGRPSQRFCLHEVPPTSTEPTRTPGKPSVS